MSNVVQLFPTKDEIDYAAVAETMTVESAYGDVWAAIEMMHECHEGGMLDWDEFMGYLYDAHATLAHLMTSKGE